MGLSGSGTYFNGKIFNNSSSTITYTVTEDKFDVESYTMSIEKDGKKGFKAKGGHDKLPKGQLSLNAQTSDHEKVNKQYKQKVQTSFISILPHQQSEIALSNLFYYHPGACDGKQETYSILTVWVGTEENIQKYLFKNVPIKSQKTINLQFKGSKDQITWESNKDCYGFC